MHSGTQGLRIEKNLINARICVNFLILPQVLDPVKKERKPKVDFPKEGINISDEQFDWFFNLS